MCDPDETNNKKITNIMGPVQFPEKEEDSGDEDLERPKLRLDMSGNRDPIAEKRKKDQAVKPLPFICICKPSIIIEPTISARTNVKYINTDTCDENAVPHVKPKPYEYPPTKKFLRLQKQNKTNLTEDFCNWPFVNVNKPLAKTKLDLDFDVPSPEPSKAKVKPLKTCPSLSLLYPAPQLPDQLEAKKPKSGTFINEPQNENAFEDYDSFDLLYKKKPRPPWPSVDECTTGKVGNLGPCPCKPKSKKSKTKEDDTNRCIEPGAEEEEVPLTKFLKRHVSLLSATTSYNSKDYPGPEEDEFPPGVAKILQKFKRESDIKRFGAHRRKFKRGTLQSHSLTDVCQPTLKDFFFGSKEGTMHQGDESFPDRIRDKQGVCMPVAAFCYSILKHPNKWTRDNVDDVLTFGNNLLNESLNEAHVHNLQRVVPINVLRKYITIGDKKLRFHIGEPDIAGYIRSDDKIVYNITKALNIFFHRHNSGILKTKHFAIGLWKQKYYYMFDARARTKDLYYSPGGAAIMAVFYDVASLATILLTRSNFGNWPFAIHPLKVYRVIPAEDEEVDSQIGLNIRSEYNILNENKAVVLGSFDLGDKCFDFTRYKQSLTMSVIALVYSRLTPPSAWHRKTVDKILVIGNLLYREALCCTNVDEVKLEHIPAIFTVGPYIVEIYIYASVFADVIFRNCVCQLQCCLEVFFTKCTNGILQFGKCHLAVWKQRNMFYCFDPYSRDNEAYRTRDGCACVSMHSTLESLIETIVHNFDKDAIFYIHALKVCKIHRDPVQTHVFPKHLCMDEFPLDCFRRYKMKKSKKKATEKPVTVDYSAVAMRRLLAGESPNASIVEIGSHVESLALEQLNALMKKCPSKTCVCFHPQPIPDIADLDSPSLQDTQIEPSLPQQIDEGIEFMDVDSFGPTMDELEMEGEGEGEEYGEYEALVEGMFLDEKEGEGEGEDWYYGKTGYSQYDLAGKKTSAQINTEITYFPIKRDILYPTCLKGKQAMKKRLERMKYKDDWENYLPPCPPTVTQSQELRFNTNFAKLPDNSEIILGTKNLVGAMIGSDVPIEYVAPFICIMADVVAKKYTILTWTTEIVDYVLKCGNELFGAAKLRYDQVSKLEIPKITLGSTVFAVLVEYVFDNYTKATTLELALDKILFVRSNFGVIVTPAYACAVMFRNHLYYLYDPYGNNELGHSEGLGKNGVAVFARFKDIHSLVTRILFNKRKRENNEDIAYSRFVVSTVKVREIIDYAGEKYKKKEESKKKPKPEVICVGADEEPASRKPENRVGYYFEDGMWILPGTKVLTNKSEVCEDLKEDHFICICACLMLFTTPIEKWSTKKVNSAYCIGKNVYCHAESLLIVEKRYIRNILIEKNFFDVIVKKLETSTRGELCAAVESVVARRIHYFMVQFPNACYLIHQSPDGVFHFFDPYGVSDGKPAGWIKCCNVHEVECKLINRILEGCECFSLFNFDVMRISKAPRSVILSYKLELFDMKPKPPKKEKLGRAFYEDSDWLDMDPVAWSRMNQRAANGNLRGTIENMWYNWDIEYPDDLWSLLGNINQRNIKFSDASRGKQTLANLVVAVGMIRIYELTEWNSAVVDSVLVNGENYFLQCLGDNKQENYELGMDDLKPDCSIFPFQFTVEWSPVVEGTMFLVRPSQFNLYKALRSFFANVNCRSGIVLLTKCQMKRQVAFGKIKEAEYYVFDCDCRGKPMFVKDQDVAYILRMTSFLRLLHVLTLILRGGDFYIYDVVIGDMKPMS
ncbi:unnamed protein product [Phyllotreta striolata]|uniref:Uncharacterized protein n=1 Tax=Phyllotreta striolata TaxID=444603 RepID=A0A9N9TCN9_PHYSR|nr:unnamed protein product [Phyllotreta striolata]